MKLWEGQGTSLPKEAKWAFSRVFGALWWNASELRAESLPPFQSWFALSSPSLWPSTNDPQLMTLTFPGKVESGFLGLRGCPHSLNRAEGMKEFQAAAYGD